MLPFKSKEGSMSGPIENVQLKTSDEDKDYDFLEDVCMDFIHAIHAKDPSAAADAIKAIFNLLDSQPHEEGPHV